MNLPGQQPPDSTLPSYDLSRSLAYWPVLISTLKSWLRSSTAHVTFTMSASFSMMASNAGWFARHDALLM